LTFDSASDIDPVWSPDGSSIIFRSNRDGHYDLYQKFVNGGKGEVVLLKSNESKIARSWSPDGRLLLYTVVRPKGKSELWVLPLWGERKPVPFLVTDFNVDQARFSPDGHWVAYVSDESGSNEIYVAGFSMNSAGTQVEVGGKWQISNGFSMEPIWRKDGRELYYLSLPDNSYDAKAMAVEITTRPTFAAGKVHQLGISHLSVFLDSTVQTNWDTSSDGQRFLGLETRNRHGPYTVVLNWQAALKK
jgi:Tol biopolymer transport system component